MLSADVIENEVKIREIFKLITFLGTSSCCNMWFRP